jgi:hypothetical protein
MSIGFFCFCILFVGYFGGVRSVFTKFVKVELHFRIVFCFSLPQKMSALIPINVISIEKMVKELVNEFAKFKILSGEVMISADDGTRYAIVKKNVVDEVWDKYTIEKWETIIKNRKAMKKLFSCLVDDYFDDIL